MLKTLCISLTVALAVLMCTASALACSCISNGPRQAEPVDVSLTGAIKDIVLIITEPNGTCRRCLNYRYGQNRTKRP
jgi:hypothetical protein